MVNFDCLLKLDIIRRIENLERAYNERIDHANSAAHDVFGGAQIIPIRREFDSKLILAKFESDKRHASTKRRQS
ncbi:hypothetical protein M514_16546 [Trichuris suis]|uniref:Uncharacterized protein n=1 Tax=Trichuris suis TaxID=68888 RepID=A0A085NP03_9BILA|nr:hypothetical protein M514_16546 [Trichuris suis]